MSKIKVNEIEKASGSGITVPTGTSFTVTDGIAASTLTGTVAQANIADQAINEAKLQVSNAPTNGYLLSAQSGNTGGLTWAAAPSGKVKQLVHGESSTNYSQSGSGETTCTNYNLTITPESTSSKIIVSQSQNIYVSDANGNSYHESEGYIRVYRAISGGATTQLLSNEYGYELNYVGGQTNTQNNYALVTSGHVDAPNTTSAVTYQIRIFSSHAHYRIDAKHFSGYLMEIL